MDVPKLWFYNLHYFEYLWALDYEHARAAVRDWILHYPLGRASVGWDPYPTSLRLVNWCSLFFDRFRQQVEADSRFLRRLWRSIFIQTEWLRRHIETHLLGNHLFENAAALAIVGACFSGRAAEEWYRAGKEILEKEIPEQVLNDGGHFERSPMYHGRITYILATLLNVGRADLARLVQEPCKRMLKALAYMCHPDGDIALLNDSAFGICNAPEKLIDYVGNMVGEPTENVACHKGTFHLPDSGYYGARHPNGSYVICDAGPLGPDYTPAHAHGDMFSFELSLSGNRVIVDSGVYDYEPGPMRDYCRSTKAHNTVEIDEQDQCEFWGAFRVARRGRPYDVRWQPFERGFRLTGWHDGYKRLKGRPTHRRHIAWRDAGILMVKDAVLASCSKRITSRLHLHPDCRINSLDPTVVEVDFPAGTFRIAFAGKGKLAVEESFYWPKFGTEMKNEAIVFLAPGSTADVGFCIAQTQSDISLELSKGAVVDGRVFEW